MANWPPGDRTPVNFSTIHKSVEYRPPLADATHATHALGRLFYFTPQ